MRVLVTGGAGFIGSHVVRAMSRAGHDVRVLDAFLPDVHLGGRAEAGFELPDEVEVRRGDLRDPEAVESALRGVDAVCHQAAMVGRGREILDAPRYASCNDLATAVLLAQMTLAGIRRLVHGSSVVIYGECRYRCGVHGEVTPGPRRVADLDAGRFDPPCPRCGAALTFRPVVEDDRLDPRSVYAATKMAQEHLVAAWSREVGGWAPVLRYHNVYGPGMPYDSPYSGVASTFRSAVDAGRAPQVFEDGRPRRDFVHVSDVAAANVAALGWDGAGVRPFNVATGDPHSIGEMADRLATAAGSPAPVMTGAYRLADVRHVVADPSRLIAELGWCPRVSFEQGMREFATAPMRGRALTGDGGAADLLGGSSGAVAGGGASPGVRVGRPRPAGNR